MDNQNNQPIQVLPTESIEEEASQPVKVVTSFPHHQLLSCLYFVQDAFERASLEYFLVRDTAKAAIESKQLHGATIDIGVRHNTWSSDQKDIIFTFFSGERVEQISDLPNSLTFSWRDIPFTIHIYDDNECLLALNTIRYEYETWFVPNQFERFEKEFDK